jgi:hypothetical protein
VHPIRAMEDLSSQHRSHGLQTRAKHHVWLHPEAVRDRADWVRDLARPPFWFDVLNKFMVVRSTVKPAEESKEQPSKDRPAPTTDIDAKEKEEEEPSKG